eukprot:TRINITY_DN67228_c7_g3_i1.p1 TRINITY_DN67228_c7_g3~~TRINITY_DN67228_c7_g3_i1.p1  ORF type:complete len:552 (-),score=55.29 TRINITY_DN67228_c7_g3_i1:665-2281(-)
MPKRTASSADSKASKKQKVEPVPKDKGFGVAVKSAPAKVPALRIQTLFAEGQPKGGNVLYWMSRDQRVNDNWALTRAIEAAKRKGCGVAVAFCLVNSFLGATRRHYAFMLKGLAELESHLHSLNIPFHLLRGPAVQVLPEFIKDNEVTHLVCDVSPLRIARSWKQELVAELKKSKAPICVEQVDAHNVVPIWVASPKLEYAARTIRGKIVRQLPEWLTEFPQLEKLEENSMWNEKEAKKEDWGAVLDSIEVDETVSEVAWTPGEKAGNARLAQFIKAIASYNQRNDPNAGALSGLSPWLHFGQLSAQRAVIEALGVRKGNAVAVDSFIEEILVRRELSDNFCWYNEQYDSIEGTNSWAIETLKAHADDKREYLYTDEQFEKAKTHDTLWNAAQKEMVQTGKMHGFMRMYWAKKILEWTKSPEEALRVAIWLNDKYEIDGRDPSGYVGCMWSIAGIHDQGWAERPVFGKIRYMVRSGCERKFDVKQYIQKCDRLTSKPASKPSATPAAPKGKAANKPAASTADRKKMVQTKLTTVVQKK